MSCELDVISISRGVAVGVWLAREMTGRAGDLCWLKLELSEAKETGRMGLCRGLGEIASDVSRGPVATMAR